MVDEPAARLATPNEDPHSELNVLRRELRQLQASVRDSALQIAAQQDELVELRNAVAAAEAEVEEGLVRESNLRLQLELQAMKRQQVEATMASAEALVSSLKEMILENEDDLPDTIESAQPHRAEPPLPAPNVPCTTRKETGSLQKTGDSKLDKVLDSIAGASDPPLEHPQPVQLAFADAASIEKGERNSAPLAHLAHVSAMTNDPEATTGDTKLQLVPREDISQHPASTPAPARTLSHSRASLPQGAVEKRHSLPRALPAVSLTPLPPSQKPNLLMSAFGPKSSPVNPQASTIHSSTVSSNTPLPAEVETFAKSEGVPIRRPYLPSTIAFSVNDAHSGEIYALASSNDSQWTVSGGDDKTIKVYDHMGKPCSTIAENTRAVTALAIHPESGNADAVVIYSGGSDGSVRAFRRHQRRKTKWCMNAVVPVHSQAVRKILVTGKSGIGGSSNLILTCSTDRAIRMCDVEHNRKPFSVTSPSAVLDVASFGAASGGLIVSGHKDGGLRMWSSRDGNAMIGSTKIHSKGIVSVCCLSDGQSVLSLGRDNAMRLSDIRMNAGVLREMEGGVQTVSDWHRAAVNGRHVACGLGRPGQLGVWNVDTGKLVRRVSTQLSDSDADVLDMVARKLRSPGYVMVPLWTASGQLICAHRTRLISFWNCS